MQRFVTRTDDRRRAERLLMLGALVLLFAGIPGVASASSPSAAIMGVVRDAQGVGQMGALVQVLSGDAQTVGTAFTDLHGHYLIRDINPGKYEVRASATLFVPATKGNLQLRTGARAVVNLTLAALFDTTQWLPAQRRQADEPADDWRWTLRSSANRPILRVLEDGSVVLSQGEDAASARRLPEIAIVGGSGGFGFSGEHAVISGSEGRPGLSTVLMRASMAVPAGTSAAPPVELATGFERAMGMGGVTRTMVSYRSHPEVIGSTGEGGLQVMEVAGAQTTSLGDLIDLEFGGGIRAIHSDQREGFTSTPFVRLTAHPNGNWTIRYEWARSRDLQSVDDLGPKSELPATAVVGSRLLTEGGDHQEIAITRRAGRNVIEVSVFQDSLDRVAVSGVASAGMASGLPGVMLDPGTGAFRMLNAGYKGGGAEVLLSSPLPSGIRATVQYNVGTALGGGDYAGLSPLAGAPALRALGSQAATVALKGKIKGSGAAVRALYRWQPTRMVTSVNPFGEFSDQGFLCFSVRQPLHWGDRLPAGLNATIDVTNLLEQGYRPFLSADGQTLYFAQAPRVMQAGLSFSF